MKIPNIDSIRELAEFWDTHELTEFEGQLREVNEAVFTRRKANVSGASPDNVAAAMMVTTPNQMDVPKVIRPTRRMVGLLGFLHKGEVSAIFQQSPVETEGGADPVDLWQTFRAKRDQLGPLPHGAIAELPADVAGVVAEIKRRPTYKKYYEAVADYSFAIAPIATLLAPQWMADLDYIDELAEDLGPGRTVGDQLPFAMTEGRITEPIVTGTQVLFTSPRRDLHAHPIPAVTELEGGEFEITIRATSRPNYIQVAQIGDRLVLSNGVHKVCAFLKAGYTHCPCVFRNEPSLEVAGLNPQTTSLLSPSVFGSQRPALVSDFLNPAAAAPIRMRSMYQVLQVNVGVGTMLVPALPNRGRG